MTSGAIWLRNHFSLNRGARSLPIQCVSRHFVMTDVRGQHLPSYTRRHARDSLEDLRQSLCFCSRR